MAVRQKPVEEQVIVITGASSGIGLATAHAFRSRGVKGLVLVARNEEALRSIADELSGGRTYAIAVAADVSRREDLERVARTAIDTFGGFDTWVNDAAVALYGNVAEIPIEDQRQLFEVNYWGVVNGSMIAADHLRHRGGTIVNVGSVLSERAMILQTQYSASKHAVKAFTDGLRMELESQEAPDRRHARQTLVHRHALCRTCPQLSRSGDRRSAARLRSASRREGDRLRGRAPAPGDHDRAQWLGHRRDGQGRAPPRGQGHGMDGSWLADDGPSGASGDARQPLSGA